MIATITHLTGRRRNERETFHEELVSVGRASDNRLRFDDNERRVSAHHAQISRHGDNFLIRDLGSTNGTMINGRRIIISELSADDLIEFGAGGPLVRFGIEPTTTTNHHPAQQAQSQSSTPNSSPAASRAAHGGAQTRQEQDHQRLSLHQPAQKSPTQISRLLRRSLQKSKNNVRLTVAIVVSMLAGAGFGVWLSMRLNSYDSLVSGFTSIAERNRDAVVLIQTEYEYLDSDGNLTGLDIKTGSGFLISDSGLIVTNRHLVRDYEYNPPPFGVSGRVKKISVVFANRRRDEAVSASLAHLSSSTDVDVAILRIQPSQTLTAVYGIEADLRRVSQGDAVATLGYPLGFHLLPKEESIAPTLSTGYVSRLGQDVLLSLQSYHGSSGAPVFNRRGNVIAIVTANPADAQELTICTPIGAAIELLRDELSYPPQRHNRKEKRDVSTLQPR